MATTSGMTALDVVVRERLAIDALPSVVRTIRQFAQEPFASRLERALRTYPTAVAARTIEQLLLAHAEDKRIDALESGRGTSYCWTDSLPENAQSSLIWKAIAFGAQAGSVPIVAWACSATLPPGGHVYPALMKAIEMEHFDIVKLLYRAATPNHVNDDYYLSHAARHGRMEILQWLYANRSDAHDYFPLTTAHAAIASGKVDVLKWLCAMWHREVSQPSVPIGLLAHATVHGQERIMDWCYDNLAARERWSDVSRHFLRVLQSHWKLEHIVWLHEKFPATSISDVDLEWHTITTPGDSAKVCELIKAFPLRYARHGVTIGAALGDLELVKLCARGRELKLREVKRAMVRAAGHDHLDVVEYLHEISGGVIAVRALWRALRRGFLDIVVWMLEHKPELRTRARLLEMREESLKQAPSNARGDMEEVTRWLDAALESSSSSEQVESRGSEDYRGRSWQELELK